MFFVRLCTSNILNFIYITTLTLCINVTLNHCPACGNINGNLLLSVLYCVEADAELHDVSPYVTSLHVNSACGCMRVVGSCLCD